MCITVSPCATVSSKTMGVSLLQCREHLMNVVIPREDHTMKVSVLLYSQHQQEKHM